MSKISNFKLLKYFDDGKILYKEVSNIILIYMGHIDSANAYERYMKRMFVEARFLLGYWKYCENCGNYKSKEINRHYKNPPCKCPVCICKL